jgi:hypothetical protein
MARPVSRALTVTLPPDVAQLATLQATAEREAPVYAGIVVESPDDLAFADALLTDVVTRKDAAVAMRKRVTGPAYAIAKEVEAWFRPLVSALTKAEDSLKNTIGAYRLRVFETEEAARELAAQAAEQRDPEALVEALTVATEIQATPDEARATTSFRWTVKRINPDLLPDEWWCPDAARIDAVADAAPGEGDAPVIPGVVFERAAKVGAKR